ncbi:hypothetical protein Tco_0961012, partial [Tanacetum coccineum]
MDEPTYQKINDAASMVNDFVSTASDPKFKNRQDLIDKVVDIKFVFNEIHKLLLGTHGQEPLNQEFKPIKVNGRLVPELDTKLWRKGGNDKKTPPTYYFKCKSNVCPATAHVFVPQNPRDNYVVEIKTEHNCTSSTDQSSNDAPVWDEPFHVDYPKDFDAFFDFDAYARENESGAVHP